jgi:nitrite reductase/ring-hydroxylating ferredoxin subunit
MTATPAEDRPAAKTQSARVATRRLAIDAAHFKTSPFARLFAGLEGLPGLESLSDGIAGALAPVTSRRGLMDLLHGRWIGHALHPALSDLPLGLWSGAALLDLFDDDRGATLMTAAGCVSAVATATTGVADWSVTAGRDRRLALVHGLANSAVLGMQFGALAARMRGRRRLGQVLSASGLGAGMAAAYVGGELVFGRGLMVDHLAFTVGPTKWTPVLADGDLSEGAMQAVDVEGRKVLLARVDGLVCAIENTCSHAGGPLCEGSIADGVVTCPWHGSQFRLGDGAVIGGPATFPQLQLQVRQRKGQIEVRGRESA